MYPVDVLIYKLSTKILTIETFSGQPRGKILKAQ